MALLSPDDIERIKGIIKELQGKRLVGGPVDDIGPLDITIDNTLCGHREYDVEKMLKVIEEMESFIEKKENENANKKSS